MNTISAREASGTRGEGKREGPMKSARVLVLDDAASVHARIRLAFHGLPIVLSTTDSWVDTKTHVFSDTPPDLIILDLQMPTIDGRAVGRAIKRRMDIPIVVYSSEAAGRLSAAMQDIGAEAAVSKSASDAELVSTVTRLLEKRSAVRAAI